jgi:hypothetical protein
MIEMKLSHDELDRIALSTYSMVYENSGWNARSTYSLKQDIAEWLNTNIDVLDWRWNPINPTVFKFTNQSDAIMFKLTVL